MRLVNRKIIVIIPRAIAKVPVIISVKKRNAITVAKRVLKIRSVVPKFFFTVTPPFFLNMVADF